MSDTTAIGDESINPCLKNHQPNEERKVSGLAGVRTNLRRGTLIRMSENVVDPSKLKFRLPDE